MQRFLKLLSIMLGAFLTFADASPPRQGYYQQDPSTAAIKEVQSSLETLKHKVRNQETEIRVFEEKLENLDTIIESVREEFSDASKSQKEQIKTNSGSLETRLTSLETSVKGILTDLKQFQAFTAESSAALALYQKKITDFEKSIALQNQNMDDMQAAIGALSEVLQIKHGVAPKSSVAITAGSDAVYMVKEGDSLEKIAKANRTTIKAIKELNSLTSDRIVVGKQLKIPAS